MTPFLQRIALLIMDVSILYAHTVTPESYVSYLPDISQGWGNFLETTGDEGSGDVFAGRWGKWALANFRADREAVWRRFTAGIPTQEPSLNMLHTLLPHVPLEFLPSGRN